MGLSPSKSSKFVTTELGHETISFWGQEVTDRGQMALKSVTEIPYSKTSQELCMEFQPNVEGTHYSEWRLCQRHGCIGQMSGSHKDKNRFGTLAETSFSTTLGFLGRVDFLVCTCSFICSHLCTAVWCSVVV